MERWATPAPGKPLFEVAAGGPGRPERGEPRGPLLLVCSGAADPVHSSAGGRFTPREQQRGAVTTVRLPDRGPSLTIDHGRPGVVELVLRWMGTYLHA